MGKILPKKIKFLGIPITRKIVVEWKIYFDRARMYLGYINFIMIAFVFLNAIEDNFLRQFLDTNKLVIYPIVMIAFIVLSLLLGRLDTKLGMRKEELRNYAAANPVMMEILQTVTEIRSNQTDHSKSDSVD